MVAKVFIPQAFENMEEATVGRWIKAEGDIVHAGDALCELITEKTTFDLPAEAEGVLRRIVAPEKSVVPVGYCIALISDGQDELPDVDAENAAILAKRQEASTREEGAPQLDILTMSIERPTPSTPGGSRVRATPAARRAARERAITIEEVAAAFPGKVVTEEDVAKFGS